MLSWSLPYNKGRFEATWKVTASSKDHFTCDFQLIVRSYHSEGRGTLEQQHRLAFSFTELMVQVAELSRFAGDLERWLCLPLPDLRKTPLVSGARLGGRFDEYLTLR